MGNIWDNEILVDVLKVGGVVVMPADTIYGVSGVALNEETINRIYRIKRREPTKPSILLIGGAEDLVKFSITLSSEQKGVLKKYWPGPISVVLDCDNDSLFYLHRGTKTLAFRLPKEKGLQDLLKKVGPLITTSANLADQPVAKNISEARNYFGELVDLYVDGGEINGRPSKLIKLHKDGSVSILRE